MDKTTAQRIVRETFNAPFGRKRHRDFINERCNDKYKALFPDLKDELNGVRPYCFVRTKMVKAVPSPGFVRT